MGFVHLEVLAYQPQHDLNILAEMILISVFIASYLLIRTCVSISGDTLHTARSLDFRCEEHSGPHKLQTEIFLSPLHLAG